MRTSAGVSIASGQDSSAVAILRNGLFQSPEQINLEEHDQFSFIAWQAQTLGCLRTFHLGSNTYDAKHLYVTL